MSYFEFVKEFSIPIYIALTIAAGFFAWAIVLISTAKGDPVKLEKGNKILLWTIIGFIIFSVGFLIFTFGGKFIQNRNILNNKSTAAYQNEFPPAPYQEPMPPAAE